MKTNIFFVKILHDSMLSHRSTKLSSGTVKAQNGGNYATSFLGSLSVFRYPKAPSIEGMQNPRQTEGYS